jgi:hypothetical protein
MITLHVGRNALGIGVAVVLLAGCGGAQNATTTVPAPGTLAPAASGPPSCKGQHTTKKYGDITATLKTKGGSFCVPAFGGFGGSIEYPGVERAVKLTIRTSTENIYDEPQLGTTGTSMVYLNLHFHEGTHFGSNLKSAGGLTSESIDPGNTYTAYGIVAVGNLYLRFPPCYTIATQGPYGGVLPNLGNLFGGTTITGAGYGVIEIYPGQQVSEEC